LEPFGSKVILIEPRFIRTNFGNDMAMVIARIIIENTEKASAS
jgi:hypothetical protein